MKTLFRHIILAFSVAAAATPALAGDHGYNRNYRYDNYSRYDSYNRYDNYDHHAHHGGRHSNDAAYLVGGLLLGAAIAELADSPRRTYSSSYPSRYSSTTVYSDYPTTYSTYTRTYPAPVIYRERETIYSPEVTRDEDGRCYEVTYRDGRRTLRQIGRDNCDRY